MTLFQRLRAKTRCLLVTICLALITANAPAAEQKAASEQKNGIAKTWQAGSSRVNITPKRLIWLSGYGSRDRPAEGKLTDLWAKALVMQDPSGRRVVLVTLDLVGIDRGISTRVCTSLSKKHNLRRSQIALATTHTHTGPVVGANLRAMYFMKPEQFKQVAEYTTILEKKIDKVVDEAIKNLAPAKISWNTGHCTFAVNRRNNSEAKVPVLRAAGKLVGPVCYDVPVLAVRDLNNKLRTVVCGYACHATVLSFYKYSGDWPGFAQIEIERRHPEVLAMVWAGCGADQNPLPRRKVEQAQDYGRQLANAVERVLAGVMRPVAGNLRDSYSEIDLPFAQIPSRDELQKTTLSKNRYESSRARLLLGKLKRDGLISPTYPYPLQFWKLGATGPNWIIMGGEVVVDYVNRFKMDFGQERTWVTGYANDVMAYIPSRRVLREGGYEGSSAMLYYGLPSAWAPGIEKQIAQEVRRQVETSKSDGAKKNNAEHQDLTFFRDKQGKRQLIKTAADWKKRRAQILLGMQQAMGPLPDLSKPIEEKPQIIRQEKGPGYTRLLIRLAVEKGDTLPAHLYLPGDIKPGQQRPAMLALHPTSSIGKRVVAGESERPNRAYAVELAKRGYIVIAPDYPSFGDYKEYDFLKDRYISGTMKGIVNHIRCVDYLCSRTDVDPTRIGVIGHSLGGHNAMFVGVFDSRLKIIVSSCGWTPFHDYYGGKIAGWTSARYMPRLKTVYQLDPDRVPFDFYEVTAALAPRVFYSNSPVGDSNFDYRGVKKAIPQARSIYKLLGAEKNLIVRYPDCQHDFPVEIRRDTYRVIDRVLKHQPTKRTP